MIIPLSFSKGLVMTHESHDSHEPGKKIISLSFEQRVQYLSAIPLKTLRSRKNFAFA